MEYHQITIMEALEALEIAPPEKINSDELISKNIQNLRVKTNENKVIGE